MEGLRDLVARARGGRLRASEMSDPTITATNLGEQGVELASCSFTARGGAPARAGRAADAGHRRGRAGTARAGGRLSAEWIAGTVRLLSSPHGRPVRSLHRCALHIERGNIVRR